MAPRQTWRVTVVTTNQNVARKLVDTALSSGDTSEAKAEPTETETIGTVLEDDIANAERCSHGGGYMSVHRAGKWRSLCTTCFHSGVTDLLERGEGLP